MDIGRMIGPPRMPPPETQKSPRSVLPSGGYLLCILIAIYETQKGPELPPTPILSSWLRVVLAGSATSPITPQVADGGFTALPMLHSTTPRQSRQQR